MEVKINPRKKETRQFYLPTKQFSQKLKFSAHYKTESDQIAAPSIKALKNTPNSWYQDHNNNIARSYESI